MREANAAVKVCSNHAEAESAIKQLRDSGFDLRKLSIAGKDDHREEQVVAYYNAGEGMKYWGNLEAFWSSLWRLLFGWAFLVIPGVGPVLVAGPLAGWIVAGLENAAIFGGLGVLGAGLYSIGIPKDSVFRYEAAVKANKLLVIAHGGAEEVERARRILETGGTLSSAAPAPS